MSNERFNNRSTVESFLGTKQLLEVTQFSLLRPHTTNTLRQCIKILLIIVILTKDFSRIHKWAPPK